MIKCRVFISWLALSLSACGETDRLVYEAIFDLRPFLLAVAVFSAFFQFIVFSMLYFTLSRYKKWRLDYRVFWLCLACCLIQSIVMVMIILAATFMMCPECYGG